MKKIDQVLKKLSELYEFNRQIQQYRLKNKSEAAKSCKKDQPAA